MPYDVNTFLGVIMKTSQWIARIFASAALVASGSTFADVGMADGADSFKDFQSTKSRADVATELGAAKSQGLLSHGDVDTWALSRTPADIGARGPAGSRYTGRTREEVRAELQEYRTSGQENSPNYIYRN